MRSTGKSVKLKMRCAFLDLDYKGKSNTERTKEINKVTGAIAWPEYLRRSGREKEWAEYHRASRKRFKSRNKDLIAKLKAEKEQLLKEWAEMSEAKRLAKLAKAKAA